MEKQEIKEYLESITKDFSKIDFNYFLKIIDEFDILNMESNISIIHSFAINVRRIGAILSANNEYNKMSQIYNRIIDYIPFLYNKKNINVLEMNSFYVMQIKSLAFTGNELAAISQTQSVIKNFWDNRKKYKIECKKLDQEEKSITPRYVTLVMSMKYLCRFSKILSTKVGNNEFAGYFFYQEKVFEIIHHWHHSYEERTTNLLFNEHIAIIPGRYDVFFINTSKGFESISVFLNTTYKFLIGIISYLVWGFGERIYRVIIFMLVVIFGYAVLYSIYPFAQYANKISNSTLNFSESLYLSIVTFSTLGYGDIIAKPDLLSRLVVGSEALMGIAFMSMFIFTLSRKVTR